MRGSRVWRRVWRKVLGVEQVTVEDRLGFEFEGDEDDEVLVVAVRATRGRWGRCSRRDRRCSGYDQGTGT